jgi:hypothetical protein
MRNPRGSQNRSFRGVATIVGAVAGGAFAIGTLASGRLAIRQAEIESAKINSLEMQDPAVKRLHAAEITVSDSLTLPRNNFDREIAS